MIDRTTISEQLCDAVVVGDIGRDRDGIELFGNRIEALDVARCNDDVGALPFCQFRGRKADT